MSGADLITTERQRQIEEEEWTAEHDDALHKNGALVSAAIVYSRCALTHYAPDNRNAAAPMKEPPTDWPWGAVFYKPTWSDPVRNLVKAGALIAAEIDRLQREEKN